MGGKSARPEDEEKGVETYSFLWGRRIAVAAWLAMLCLGLVFACLAASEIDFLPPVAAITLVMLGAAAILGGRFLHAPASGRAKALETFSGIWVLVMYLNLGGAPR